MQLTEGDVVVFYTDGVTEAISEGKEEFGQGQLAEIVVENRSLTAQGLIDKINAAVTAFIGGEPQFDDFTLVVLKCVWRRDNAQAMGIDGGWPPREPGNHR